MKSLVFWNMKTMERLYAHHDWRSCDFLPLSVLSSSIGRGTTCVSIIHTWVRGCIRCLQEFCTIGPELISILERQSPRNYQKKIGLLCIWTVMILHRNKKSPWGTWTRSFRRTRPWPKSTTRPANNLWVTTALSQHFIRFAPADD